MWWVDGWKEGRKNGWIIRKQKRKVWGCDTHSHLGSENPLTSSHVQFGASPVRVGVDAALKHSPRGLHWSAVLGIRLWCTHKDPAHQEERAFGTKKGQLMVKSSPNHGCVVWMLPGRSYPSTTQCWRGVGAEGRDSYSEPVMILTCLEKNLSLVGNTYHQQTVPIQNV